MSSERIIRVKKACGISDSIFKDVLRELKKKSFETELDVYEFLKEKTKEKGCRFAFKPLVASGKNTREIHHKACKDKIRKGFLMIDFGVKYKGYCSDCTRTFYIGKPTKKELRIYNLVLKTQLIALSYAYEGMNTGEVDAIARASFNEYMKYFKHPLGHGIGKRVHEFPSLKPNNRFYLKKGMIVTIEPGLYLKEFGVRIEDTVLIGEKAIVLTKFRKDLIIVN